VVNNVEEIHDIWPAEDVPLFSLHIIDACPAACI